MGLVYGQDLKGITIPELSTCGLANKLPYAFELSSVLFFLAPWTLIVVLYILIGLKLYKSKRDSSRTTCSAHCRHTGCLSSTNTRATGRVVKMLGKSKSKRIWLQFQLLQSSWRWLLRSLKVARVDEHILRIYLLHNTYITWFFYRLVHM